MATATVRICDRCRATISTLEGSAVLNVESLTRALGWNPFIAQHRDLCPACVRDVSSAILNRPLPAEGPIAEPPPDKTATAPDSSATPALTPAAQADAVTAVIAAPPASAPTAAPTAAPPKASPYQSP